MSYKSLLHIVFVLSVLSVHVPVVAQLIDFDENNLEQILEKISEKTNQTELLDQIENLNKNSLNLKTTTIREIASIPTISYLHARKISILAKEGKSIKDIIDELRLNEESAYLLQYCSYIDDTKPSEKKEDFFASRSRAAEQLNGIYGFEKDKFLGGRTDLYQRFLGSFSDFSASILFAKDMGEQYRHGFISGFINADFNGFKITAGDFYIKAGLGNILWYQNAMGKSSDVISPANQFENSVINYKSSSEFGFFRGGAVSDDILFSDNSVMSWSFWLASTPRSATIDTSLDIATSIYETGLFRTESEINKMYSLKERTAGYNINYKFNNLIFGSAGYYLSYDKEVRSESGSVFSGKNGLFASVYAMIPFQDLNVSFETSRDPNGFMAYKLNGLLKKQDYELTLHGRFFSESFRSPFGFIFGESSNPNNEYGIYTGFAFYGIKNIRLSTYLDLFSSIGPTYYVPEKVRGLDFLNEAIIKLSGEDEARLRLQYETKTDALTINSGTGEKDVFFRSKYYARFEYIYRLFDDLRIKNRIEGNLVNFDGVKLHEFGFATYIEATYKLLSALKLTGRFAYFSTKSYESAIWQYELVLPGYMSSPPLYGNGFRTFVSVIYEPWVNLSFALRYSLMRRYNVSSLGSGYNEIYGNTDHRIYFQIDLSL